MSEPVDPLKRFASSTPGFARIDFRPIQMQLTPLNAAVRSLQTSIPVPQIKMGSVLENHLRDRLAAISKQSFEAWNSVLKDIGDQLEKNLQDAMPDNCRHEARRVLDEATPIVKDSGIPLMWVPEASIVTDLLDAPDEGARFRLLAAADRLISTAAEDVLTGVTSPRLAKHAEFAAEAITALRSGHPKAAQALAGSLLDTVLFDVFAKKPTSAKNAFDIDTEEATLAELRFALTVGAVPRACQNFHVEQGDPVPYYFNRHATVHSVGDVQYTHANAVVGCMLVASLLREAQWIDENQPSAA